MPYSAGLDPAVIGRPLDWQSNRNGCREHILCLVEIGGWLYICNPMKSLISPKHVESALVVIGSQQQKQDCLLIKSHQAPDTQIELTDQKQRDILVFRGGLLCCVLERV